MAELEQKEPPMDGSHLSSVAELKQKERPMTEREGKPPMTEVSLIASEANGLAIKVVYSL